MRKQSEMLQLFPAYLKGEDLFGLTVSAVARIAESVSADEAGDAQCAQCGPWTTCCGWPCLSNEASVFPSLMPFGGSLPASLRPPALHEGAVPTPDGDVCGYCQVIGRMSSLTSLCHLLILQACLPMSPSQCWKVA